MDSVSLIKKLISENIHQLFELETIEQSKVEHNVNIVYYDAYFTQLHCLH